MFVYTSPSYATYPSPTLYPVSHFVSPRAPTAHESYLLALAEAQSARERYVAELKEERILASLRQQEALRQEEFRRRDALRQSEFRRRAAQDFISRRRASRPCVGSCYQPVSLGSSAEQQAFSQIRRATAVQRQQEQTRTLEELFEAFLGGGEKTEKEEESKLKEQQEVQEVRAEHARQAALHNARVHFISKLDAIREEAKAVRDSRAQQPVASTSSSHVPAHSTPTPTTSHNEKPPVVPLTRQPEIPRSRNPNDRAARTIQRQWRSHSADAIARMDALSTIDILRARFQFLKGTFSFPEHLEFKDRAPGQEKEVPALVYSPSNAAVHSYTHELTKLLLNADAIPSGGSRRVREERRTFVKGVEEEIEAVEARVREIWDKKVAIAALEHHEAEDVSNASAITTNAQTTEPTSVDVVEEDKEVASDAAAAEDQEATVDSDIPASPSTIVPSRPHFDGPSKSDPPSELEVEMRKDDVVPAEPIPIPQAEPTAVEVSHGVDAIDTALTDTDDSTTCVRSNSVMSQAPPPSPQELSETRQEAASPAVPSFNTASSNSDATSLVDPIYPNDTPDSTTTTEPFDVVYPSSSSSTSSELEDDSQPGARSGVTVRGDDAVLSEKHIHEAVASTSGTPESQDDGFELL